MTDHDYVAIGFFLMGVWFLGLINFHPKSKLVLLFYSIGSFVLGVLALTLSFYGIGMN